MKTQADKTQEPQKETVQRVQQEHSTGGEATITDNRPTSAVQSKLRSVMVSSGGTIKPIQRKNNTGLPDNLKSGIENLSGYSMDDVKVHYNSSKPAQLQAHAYAQGTDIHLAPGQQKHLPHEAWHVVQQKQGRVKSTRQFKGNVNINDDAALEKEADIMGAKALQFCKDVSDRPIQLKTSRPANSNPIQRYKTKKEGLTVAGEFHSKSEEQRGLEEEFAKYIKSREQDSTDQFLWKEDKTPGIQPAEAEYLDDHEIASEKPEHLAISNVDRIKYYQPILIEELSKSINSLDENISKPKDNTSSATIRVCANALMTAIESMLQNLKDAGIDVKYGSEIDTLIYDWKQKEKRSLLSIVQEIEEKGYFSDEDKKTILDSNGFLGGLEKINTLVSLVLNIPKGREISHNFIRSRAMHELANEKKDVQGIWLIGQYHVQEIQEHLRNEVEYDLVSMIDFNNDIKNFVGLKENAFSLDNINDRTGDISVAARQIKSSFKYFIDIKRKEAQDRFPNKSEEEIASEIKFHVNRLVINTAILVDIKENDLQKIDFTNKFPGMSNNIVKEIEEKIDHIKNRIGVLFLISDIYRSLEEKGKKMDSPPEMLTYLSAENIYKVAADLERLTSIAK
ncbi:eCIS core domain-containing protein [Aquimarina sp. 2304DJ70-9]|uniref:eCIS core domain-containing protein n=1 Tax=Aquimarina penaris TaxID=3231044 RepID=UPI0034619AB0